MNAAAYKVLHRRALSDGSLAQANQSTPGRSHATSESTSVNCTLNDRSCHSCAIGHCVLPGHMAEPDQLTPLDCCEYGSLVSMCGSVATVLHAKSQSPLCEIRHNLLGHLISNGWTLLFVSASIITSIEQDRYYDKLAQMIYFVVNLMSWLHQTCPAWTLMVLLLPS